MTIPPLLVYLAGVALVLFIGGTLAGLHSLRRRVKALEESNQRRAEQHNRTDTNIELIAADLDELREEVRTLQNS